MNQKKENKILLVVSAIILKDNKVLLIKRSKKPFKDYWSFISGQGAFKHTNNPLKAVKLETKYDLNCKFSGKFFSYSYTNSGVPTITLFFVGKIKGNIKINKKYVKNIKWLSLKEASKIKLAFEHNKIIDKLTKNQTNNDNKQDS
ncbi:MAG: NUDIX domain-containing protein [Nanoarchaeota archaeon]